MEASQSFLSDITFTEKLSESPDSARFLVHIHSTPYFLKVHRGQGPIEPPPIDREVDTHICEVRAYQRLREHGRCDRGVIPKYHGSIENLNLELYKPHLDMFLNDEYPPKAILLEYIPDMEQLHWKNYTDAKRDNFIKGLAEIHAAGVIHDDIHPRNMMVVKGDPERAIWIDFDRAQTWDNDNLTGKEKEWLQFESELAADQLGMMKADAEEGQTNKTARFYCKYWKISSIFSPRTQEIKWMFERGFGVSYARKLQKERGDPRSAVEAWKAGGK